MRLSHRDERWYPPDAGLAVGVDGFVGAAGAPVEVGFGGGEEVVAGTAVVEVELVDELKSGVLAVEHGDCDSPVLWEPLRCCGCWRRRDQRARQRRWR